MLLFCARGTYLAGLPYLFWLCGFVVLSGLLRALEAEPPALFTHVAHVFVHSVLGCAVPARLVVKLADARNIINV